MTEISRPWSGTVIGDAGPYTDQNWRDAWEQMLARGSPNLGVLRSSYSDFLATGAASPIAIAAGAAMINGLYYESDSSVNITVPTPVGATRIDRVVLRKTWATQQARLTRIAGVEGAGVPPALTQVDGNTWDIPLWIASITVGGVITLTDERRYIGPFDGLLSQGYPYNTVYNSANEEVMAEWTIPAGTMGTNGQARFHITAQLEITGALTNTTFRYYFGNQLFSAVHGSGGTLPKTFFLYFFLDVMNANAQNLQTAFGRYFARDGSVATLAPGVLGGAQADQGGYTVAGVITSADVVMRLTAQMSVANVASGWKLSQARCWIKEGI
jgi:hypothetical protein